MSVMLNYIQLPNFSVCVCVCNDIYYACPFVGGVVIFSLITMLFIASAVNFTSEVNLLRARFFAVTSQYAFLTLREFFWSPIEVSVTDSFVCLCLLYEFIWWGEGCFVTGNGFRTSKVYRFPSRRHQGTSFVSSEFLFRKFCTQ